MSHAQTEEWRKSVGRESKAIVLYWKVYKKIYISGNDMNKKEEMDWTILRRNEYRS
jgi:hypothetical protein